MINRPQSLVWVLLPKLCIIFFYLFTYGCEETTSLQNLTKEEGLKFFERKDTVQVNMPALNKLAKEESLSLINAGEFFMGSPEGEVGRSSDEIRNRVQISQPFWIKKFEVTQELSLIHI